MSSGENVELITCPQCGCEHWLNNADRLEVCDLCGYRFPQPTDGEE